MEKILNLSRVFLTIFFYKIFLEKGGNSKINGNNGYLMEIMKINGNNGKLMVSTVIS